MSTGVYQIVNIRTYQFYIGSAKNFNTRYGLIPNWTNHHNVSLRQDANNGDEFIYGMIQKCNTPEEALCMEQWWIDFYVMNNLWDCLYNKNKCVWNKPDNTGRKQSDEERNIRRIAQNKPETKAKKSVSEKIAQNRHDVKIAKSINGKIAQNKQEVIEARIIKQNTPEIKIKWSGENCYTAKLTNLEVLEIRQKYAITDITMIMLAREYNVSYTCINAIINRRTWTFI